MKTSLRIFALSVAVLTAVVAGAQSVRFFPADVMLSNSQISTIYQDSIGYVWICTSDGLNRYDGYKVTTYRHEADNDRSLLFNRVQTVNNDREGRLLVGTRKMGLQCYNYDTDDFTTIPLGDGNTGVYQIYVAPDGVTYVLTVRQGIKRLTWPGEKPLVENVKILPDGVRAERMLVDHAGMTWIIANGGRLFYKRGNGLAAEVEFAPQDGKPYVTCIFVDTRGVVYAGTERQGLYVFDAMTQRMRRLTMALPMLISDIQQADEGHLFLATDGDGMKIVNLATGMIAPCFTNIACGDMRHDKLVALCCNQNGDLWVGAFRKGFYFCPKMNYGFHYLMPSFRSMQNDCKYVTALAADHANGVWMAVEGNGLFHFDNVGKQTVSMLYSSATGLPQDVVSLHVADDGRLWVGSYHHNVGWTDGQGGAFHPLPSDARTGHDFTRVMGIAEAPDGSLWFATNGNGLAHYHPQGGQTEWYDSKTEPKSDDRIYYEYLSCICMNQEAGLVFFGTGNGIGCYDTVKKSFKSVFGKDHIFNDISVNDICFDKQGHLWAASDEGLLMYDIHSRKELHFTQADGLPSNIVCAVRVDGDGNLWISTLTGLAHMNQTDKRIMRYYATDGLQGNEFSRSVVDMSSNGKIFFGGINGVTAFMPREITKVNRTPGIWPSELLVGSRTVTTFSESGGHSIIDQAITGVEHIRLSYQDATFSIGFSTFSYEGEMGVTYYYSIDGEEWHMIRRGDNHVAFTNLAPGNYVLRVKARVGEMESEVREISIRITPPWYASWWAYMIYMALAAVVAYFLWQRYNERQQEKLSEMRLRFFTDISHDIRTPLTLIISPLDQLLREKSLSAEVHSSLQLMYTNAYRILELVNQLLTIRKIDKGQRQLQCREVEVVHYLEDAARLFQPQAQSKKITLTYHHHMDELLAWIDHHFIDKVMSNLLGNALKYTPEGGKVDLLLTLGSDPKQNGSLKDYLQVEVRDTGTGLNPEEIPHLFDRFYRSKYSLEAGGTGIGLNLCESLITRHHGTIAAENRIDGVQGSRFYFRIPLGRSYLLTEEIAEDEERPVALSLPTDEHEEQDAKATEKRVNKTGIKLLVIDDDAAILDYLTTELSKKYTVASANNGRDGLQIALSRQPDLVICDVMMPDMNGYEFVRTLKHNPNINDIPVILLTAKSAVQDRLEGLNRGADAYITKPFHLDELHTQIRNLIDNRQRLRGKYTGQQSQEERLEQVDMKSGDEQFIERVMRAVNANLYDSDYKTEQLALDVGVSRVHLNRKLKELAGVSPGEFIRNLRLQQAARLLLEKKKDIRQIAYACGFSSISVFSSAFKKCYGMSPSSYIEQSENESNKK